MDTVHYQAAMQAYQIFAIAPNYIQGLQFDKLHSLILSVIFSSTIQQDPTMSTNLKSFLIALKNQRSTQVQNHQIREQQLRQIKKNKQSRSQSHKGQQVNKKQTYATTGRKHKQNIMHQQQSSIKKWEQYGIIQKLDLLQQKTKKPSHLIKAIPNDFNKSSFQIKNIDIIKMNILR